MEEASGQDTHMPDLAEVIESHWSGGSFDRTAGRQQPSQQAPVTGALRLLAVPHADLMVVHVLDIHQVQNLPHYQHISSPKLVNPGSKSLAFRHLIPKACLPAWVETSALVSKLI